MSAVKLVAVFSENKPGQLAHMTKVLADAKVNIRWVNIATTEAFGVVRFLVNQWDLACQELKKHGFTVSSIEVLAIAVEDKPGGLHAVADVLSRNHINVQNSSGFVSNNRAALLLEVKDVPSAQSILEKEGLRLLSQEETLNL
jgi:hypothetical protein